MKKNLSKTIVLILLFYLLISLQGQSSCGGTSVTYESIFIRGGEPLNNPYHFKQANDYDCGIANAIMLLKNLAEAPVIWDSYYFETNVLSRVSQTDKTYLLSIYKLNGNEYKTTQTLTSADRDKIVSILLSVGYQPNVKYTDLIYIADKCGFNYWDTGLTVDNIGVLIDKYVQEFWYDPAWDYKQFGRIYPSLGYGALSQGINVEEKLYTRLNDLLTNQKKPVIIGFAMWPHSTRDAGHAVLAYGIKKEAGTNDYNKWQIIYVSDSTQDSWSTLRVREITPALYKSYTPESFLFDLSVRP